MTGLRRALLAVHVATSTAGIGLEVALLAVITSAGLTIPVDQAPMVVRLLGVLAVAVCAAFVAGVLCALASPWQLLRTGWVVKKFALNLLTTASVVGLYLACRILGTVQVWTVGLIATTALAKALLSVVLSVYKPGTRRPAGAVRRATNRQRLAEVG